MGRIWCHYYSWVNSSSNLVPPLLFLLYINDLSNYLSNCEPRMYADATHLTYAGDNAANIQLRSNQDLENVYNWLRPNNHRRTSRGGARGAAAPPVIEIFYFFRAKRWRFGQTYSGENTLKGCQSQTWRLLSLTFALSRRS